MQWYVLYYQYYKVTYVMLYSGEEEASLLPTLSLAATHASDVLDMPVDPNEPTYCLCHQVSYGEMIGCDNLDVSQGSLVYHTAVCNGYWCVWLQ